MSQNPRQYTDNSTKSQGKLSYVSFDPDDATSLSADPESWPVPGLIGFGLISVLCKRELIQPLNFLVEQLCRGVDSGDDFVGFRTNQGAALLCSTEREWVLDRGIFVRDVRATPPPIPPAPKYLRGEELDGQRKEITRRLGEFEREVVSEDGQREKAGLLQWLKEIEDCSKELEEWCRGWVTYSQQPWAGLNGGQSLVGLGPWNMLLWRYRDWYKLMLDYIPRNDEAARAALFDDFNKWVVQILRRFAREREMTILVTGELNGSADAPGRNAPRGPDGEIYLWEKRGKYFLTVPQRNSYQNGPAQTIPLQRDDRGWFERGGTGGGRGANFRKANYPEDERTMDFLTANRGTWYTLEEIVRGCGAEWPENKMPYYRAVERRLVKEEKVKRKKVDGAVTYAAA